MLGGFHFEQRRNFPTTVNYSAMIHNVRPFRSGCHQERHASPPMMVILPAFLGGRIQSIGVPATLVASTLFVLGWLFERAVKTWLNIVLVMVHDVGYGDLACLGNPFIRTPSLDAFCESRAASPIFM